MALTNPIEVIENFASLDNWNVSGGLIVANNKVSGNGVPNGDAWIDVSPTNVFRMEFYITPNSTPDNGIFCGVTTAPVGDTSKWKAIAYRSNYGGIVFFNGGTTTVIIPNESLVANGTKKYKCQIISTGTEVFFTVSNEDGSGDKTLRITENLQASKIFFRVADTTDYIEKITWKPSLKKYSNSSYDTEMVLLPMINGTECYIRIPSDFNGEVRNSVLLLHGYTTTATSMWRDRANERNCNNALVSAGYITGATDAHGNNWGNPQSTQDIKSLLEYLIAKFGVNSKACLFLNSMGGLTGFNYALTHPDTVKGIMATAPCTDLTFAVNAKDFSNSVLTAHGTTKTTFFKDTRGRDPHMRFKELAKLPMKIWHASDDTVIPFNLSRNLIRTINKAGGRATLVIVTGGHSGGALWVPNEVKAFVDSVFAS